MASAPNHSRCKRLSEIFSLNRSSFILPNCCSSEDASLTSHVSSHKDVTVNTRKKPPCSSPADDSTLKNVSPWEMEVAMKDLKNTLPSACQKCTGHLAALWELFSRRGWPLPGVCCRLTISVTLWRDGSTSITTGTLHSFAGRWIPPPAPMTQQAQLKGQPMLSMSVAQTLSHTQNFHCTDSTPMAISRPQVLPTPDTHCPRTCKLLSSPPWDCTRFLSLVLAVAAHALQLSDLTATKSLQSNDLCLTQF